MRKIIANSVGLDIKKFKKSEKIFQKTIEKKEKI